MGSLRQPDIRTNNGVERQNRALKQMMRRRTDRSLSGLVTVLHKEFLPQALVRYVLIQCN